MSDDAKLGLCIVLFVVGIVVAMSLGIRHDGRVARERCAEVLRGATASDSLRIIRIAPECAR